MEFCLRAAILLIAILFASPLVAASPASERISVAAVGDVMTGSLYPTPVLPADPMSLWSDALPWTQGADIMLGNLEGSISVARPSSKVGCGQCYAFRMPPSAATDLAKVGFDAMSVANNHARDFGLEGLQEGQQHLRQAGVASNGPFGSPAARVTRSNASVVLLAFAPNVGMNDVRDLKHIASQVRSAKTPGAQLVVSFHAGAEGSGAHIVRPGSELYKGENRGDVMAASRAAIDAGADLVFAHGPHVPRALDLYKGKLIAYSLGNFATYGQFNLSGSLGLAPLLWVELTKTGAPACVRIVSFKQTKPGGPRLDSDQAAARFIMDATKRDRPEAWPAIEQLWSAPCTRLNIR